jgi:hypothetical protein
VSDGAVSSVMLERVSRTIELNPGQTKTRITRLVKPGTKPDILRAVDSLIATGYVVSTPGEVARTLVSARPYRAQPVCSCQTTSETTAASADSVENPSENHSVVSNGKPPANHNGSQPAGSAGLGNSSAMQPTADTALFREARCRVCRHPEALQSVNNLLNAGFTTAAIVDNLSGINARLPAKSRITKDSVDRHRQRHYDRQQPMGAAYRRVLEQVAAENGLDGQANILAPAAFFQSVMSKAFEALGNAEVSISEGIAAGRELAKLLVAGDQTQRWAAIQAQQARIVTCFREFVPPDRQQEMLAVLDGRAAVPSSVGAAPRVPRLALVEGAAQEPFGDDSDFDDDDDD